MNLYLISQDQNSDYDTYDSAVVAANNEDEARYTHPSPASTFRWHAEYNRWEMLCNDGTWYDFGSHSWCHPKDVKVQFVGVAADGTAPGVITSSFNAG